MDTCLGRWQVPEPFLTNQFDHRSWGREHRDLVAMEIAERRGQLDRVHLSAADLELMGENENLHLIDIGDSVADLPAIPTNPCVWMGTASPLRLVSSIWNEPLPSDRTP